MEDADDVELGETRGCPEKRSIILGDHDEAPPGMDTQTAIVIDFIWKDSQTAIRVLRWILDNPRTCCADPHPTELPKDKLSTPTYAICVAAPGRELEDLTSMTHN